MIRTVQAVLLLALVISGAAIANKQHTYNKATAQKMAATAMKRAKSQLAQAKERMAATTQASHASMLRSASNDFDYYVEYHFAAATCSDETAYQAMAYRLGTCIDTPPDFGFLSVKFVCNDQGFGFTVYSKSGCKGDSAFVLQVETAEMDTCVAGGIPWGDDDNVDDDDITQMSSASCTNDLDYGFADAPAIGSYLDSHCDTLLTSSHMIADTCFSSTFDSEIVTCSNDGVVDTYYTTPGCATGGVSSVIPTNKCLPLTNDDDDDDDDDDDFDDDDDLALGSMYVACDADSLPEGNGAITASHWATLLVWIPAVLFASAIMHQ